MGTMSNGSQLITLQYFEDANARLLNRWFQNVTPRGIYKGGYLTKVSNTSVSLAVLVCEIGDTLYQVRAETQATVSITVGTATPLVVLRWAYSASNDNGMDFVAVATGSQLANDLIVGRCTFSGSTLVGFDYALRSNPATFAHFCRVEAEATPSMRVRVRTGWANFGSSRLAIVDQLTSTLTAPVSNPRIDLVYIDSSGNIQVASGAEAVTPSAPSYSGRIPLAELSMTVGMTSITDSVITDARGLLAQSPGKRTVAWFIPGGAVVGSNVSARFYLEFSGTITKAKVYAKTAPTGANLIFDINKGTGEGSGTSIWASTQSNRVKAVAGSKTGSQTSFDTTAVAVDDFLELDIDQVGSTIAGSDITVQLEIQV